MTEHTSPNQALALAAARNAAARARESVRDDRLFEDPWASALAGSEGAAALERTPSAATPAVLRTRFFDDFLVSTVHEDAIRQVVLLGGGYDTRAFRLDWPAGTNIFEVDRPEILERKQQILDDAGAEPRCERITVAATVTAPWEAALAAAGLSPVQPTIWVLEDVLVHLSSEQITVLLQRLLKVATGGSYIAFDAVNKLALTAALGEPWAALQADPQVPWRGGLDDPTPLLKRLSWLPRLTQFGAPGAEYGRWTFAAPSEEDGGPCVWLVTARRRWRMDDGQGPQAQTSGAPGGAPLGGPGGGMPQRPQPPFRRS